MRTFEALRDVLAREAGNKPVVIAVEDLYWIDKSWEEFLDYLMGWIANAHMLLILLYRPEYAHQLGGKSYCGKIGLDQLSPKAGFGLVQAILESGEVITELGELILGRALWG